ncbi:MAG: prolipoprotein diacylglyceryl transferase [Eubacteriales bacterium]|nr:prolipoprotein diacylglyceryl transferase [Eubacteriales bacterium]
MEHAISFPALGLNFDINRVACTVFGKNIYWYGIIICLGFVLGALYLNARVKKFGFTSDHLIDCMILCVPAGIVCARIFYVAFEWGYYKNHLTEIIAVWNGGIAIYGAVIGVLLALWGYAKYKKLSFAGLCDMAALGLLIGQCVGRWGNFVNAEAHGGATGLPWGMAIDGADPVHPTFLYESVWNLVGFIILHFYSKKRKFKGEIALLYVAWYGLGRAWIEGLRTDSLYLGSLRVSQVLAVVSCIAAVILLTGQYRRIAVSKKFYVPQPAQPAEGPAAADQPAEKQAEPAPEAEAMPLPEQSPSPAGEPDPKPTPEPGPVDEKEEK